MLSKAICAWWVARILIALSRFILSPFGVSLWAVDFSAADAWFSWRFVVEALNKLYCATLLVRLVGVNHDRVNHSQGAFADQVLCVFHARKEDGSSYFVNHYSENLLNECLSLVALSNSRL